MTALYLCMVVFVVLAAGCLFGEEFGIQRIKFGHGMLGLLLLACVVVVLFSLDPLVPENLVGRAQPDAWTGPDLLGYAIPLLIGLLVGPWLDLQHWQRAIQIHRENTSIRASYILRRVDFFPDAAVPRLPGGLGDEQGRRGNLWQERPRWIPLRP
jgi:Mn2+/Fe2+ NRAMP family transporter